MGATARGIANGCLTVAEPMLNMMEAAGSKLGDRSGEFAMGCRRPCIYDLLGSCMRVIVVQLGERSCMFQYRCQACIFLSETS
jgi:hypothetical protein